MCGIVGYVGPKKSFPVLISSLERLEYRGYDSSGVATVLKKGNEASLFVLKEKGKLAELKKTLAAGQECGNIGIGHTRWATHGEPSRRNAHPHQAHSRQFAVVHNGIIENYEEIRKELSSKGFRFASDTDTEVLVHLVEYYYKKDVFQAFTQAVSRLQGFFAFALVSTYEPDTIFVFKRSNPLVIGVGKGENFIASDVPAILPYTRRVIYLEDNQIARITKNTVDLFALDGKTKPRKKTSTINWSVEQAAKGGFQHFMLKEIYEQPQSVEATLNHRIRGNKIYFEGLNKKIAAKLKQVKKVHLVSCGTAYHAGLVGSYMISEMARIPSVVTVSSEFRYGDPLLGPEDLVIVITQSGETADTLAALREAKAKKAAVIAVVNVVGSTIAREADFVIYTHAGPEIGVASTKAYVAQLAVLALFSLFLGNLRAALPAAKYQIMLKQLRRLPGLIKKTLNQDKKVKACARILFRKKNFLYLGRGYNFPNALEGALKLKEITYAHAHGYPAGEMKHGPIALIDSQQPVICLSPQSKTYEKMVSNIEEIKARKGIIINITSEGNLPAAKLAKYVFTIPRVEEFISPVLTVIPLQLFAYYVAALNNRDVDQPRNLAKSVTVE